MKFYKYSATGNDFILCNGDELSVANAQALAPKICHRKNGIGADGIITLNKSNEADFEMVIVNADGSIAGMCGNGLRAISHYAKYIQNVAFNGKYQILVDGKYYQATQVEEDKVTIVMDYVADFNKYQIDELHSKHLYVDTGVPHLVLQVAYVDEVKVNQVAPPLRSHPKLPNGANINFVQALNFEGFRVRTFERGVEDETDSCGTGVLASFISMKHWGLIGDKATIYTNGGEVSLEYKDGKYLYSASILNSFHGQI